MGGRGPGGLVGHRPDWDNPFLGAVLDADEYERIRGCSHDWEILTNAATGERRARIVDYCHSWACGVCTTSHAHESASAWMAHFSAIGEAYQADVAGFGVTFTMPADLSALIAARPDRGKIVDALFQAVAAVMRRRSLAWVAAVHYVSSKHPTKAHVHFPVFYVPVDAAGCPIAGYLADREAFADRRRAFLGAWNAALGEVCKTFGLGRWSVLNLHLEYFKTLDKLASRLHYELRPAVQDCFTHARGSADELRQALELTLSFMYPPGVVKAKRRIRGGGQFANNRITPFFESLGYKRVEKPADGEVWKSEGARLVAEYEDRCVFVIRASGEVVDVPRERVSVAGHGCPWAWVRGPG